MTRDEARKLLGGYATGTLTEAERKLLFDAALEDQDLFDELASEHALKEMIEEPGVRARLTRALEPEKQRAWWPWAAAVAGAGLATIAVWVIRQPEATQQVALNTAPMVLPVAPEPAPTAATPAPAREPERKVQPAVPAPAPTPPPPAQEKAKVAEAIAQQTVPAAADTAVSAGAIAEQRISLQAGALGASAPKPVAAARANLLADAAAPLAYEFLPSGTLRVTATPTAGTLEIRSGQQILFEARRIEGNAPVEIPIPAGIQEVRIEFTIPGQSGTVITVPVPR